MLEVESREKIFAEVLSAMPNVGRDEGFERKQDSLEDTQVFD